MADIKTNQVDAARTKEKFYIRLEEEKAMKKSRKPLTMIIIAAVLVLTAGISVFGKEIADAFKKMFVGDDIWYYQEDSEGRKVYVDAEGEPRPIPEEMAGLIFDENGNVVTSYYLGQELFYNAEGEEVYMYQDTSNKFVLETPEERYSTDSFDVSKKFTDLDEALTFFKGEALIPSYLPQGFFFDYVNYIDMQGILHTDGLGQIEIMYKSDETTPRWIGISITVLNEENKDLDDINIFHPDNVEKELLINGDRAVLWKIGSLKIKMDDALYSLMSSDGVSADELIKVAESLK